MIFVDDFAWDSAEGRRVMIVLPVSLLIGAAALWGLMRLKPWAGPISPTTRKTNTLFYVSGLVAVPGSVALHFGAVSRGNPYGFFSNSPISLGIAIVAITSWLLALAIAWWWYYSADEHERKAYDFGSLFGHGLFITVTPAWWVAARAGLLPQPDAMVLWCVTMGSWRLAGSGTATAERPPNWESTVTLEPVSPRMRGQCTQQALSQPVTSFRARCGSTASKSSSSRGRACLAL